MCEVGEDGTPALPIVMQSRIFIDFSSAEAVNQNWEQLVRFVFGKHSFKKPQVGKPPSNLLADTEAPRTPLLNKLASLRQALISSSRITPSVRTDFLDECFAYGSLFRISQPPQLDHGALARKHLQDLTDLKILRDAVTDWVLLEASADGNESFRDALFICLEQMLVLKSRPSGLSSWQEYWFDGLKVFVYKTFLYVVAALMKARSYALLGEVLQSGFLRPSSEVYKPQDRFGGVELFYGHSELLGLSLQEGNQRLHSPAAQLLLRQADRNDLVFTDVIQAELLVFLKGLTSSKFRWFPQSLVHARGQVPEFFVRAAQHRHFKNLAAVIGITNADELRAKATAGYEDSGVGNSPMFWMAYSSPWHLLNTDQYDTI